MNIYLLIQNIGSIVSAILATGFALFIFLNNRQSKANVFFALMLLSVVVYLVSHVIGVNVADPYLSRDILMGNLSMFFVGCFLLHTILLLTGKEKSRRFVLILTYVAMVILVIFFLFHPDYFWLPSVPKLYFPNYYNPGILNWTRMAFLYVLLVPYSLYELADSYGKSTSPTERSQFVFFFITLIVGFTIGFIPNFLVYNVMIDPLWGTYFFLFCLIPLTLATVKYELFNIKIVAKQAFVYGLAIAVVGGLVTILDYINERIHDLYPSFGTWVIPLTSAVILVSIAFIIWKQLRESDLLKYEFITVVTHKFRTPLTQIRWASEALEPEVSDAGKPSMDQIKNANLRLIELTNLLVHLSDTDTTDYEYRPTPFDINRLITDTLPEYTEPARLKNIRLKYVPSPGIRVLGDEAKIKFALQILFDNAVSYNKNGGSVDIVLEDDEAKKSVTVKVTDTGIGLSKEEAGRLFQKFWRSASALRADTEGMGIGLFMAKRIVDRQDGKMWAESEGLGKGSTFHLKLVAA